jgi:hypothetical protein
LLTLPVAVDEFRQATTGLIADIATKIIRWQATFSHAGVGKDSCKIREQMIVIVHLVLLMA